MESCSYVDVAGDGGFLLFGILVVVASKLGLTVILLVLDDTVFHVNASFKMHSFDEIRMYKSDGSV